MNSGSWTNYQSALPIEARTSGEPDDDDPKRGRHDHEPPVAVYVEWFVPVKWPETFTEYDLETDEPRTITIMMDSVAPFHRWFPAERWAWKHAMAWKQAMDKRGRSATIEEVF